MDQRELSMVVYKGWSTQDPNNGMEHAAISMEQEFENHRVEEMLPLPSLPVQVQPLNDLENINQLVDQIVVSIRKQIKDFLKDLIKLEKAEDPNHAFAIVGYEDKKKRGRKPTNKVVGPIFASFVLPNICFDNNVGIEEVLATKHPEQHRRFSILERAENWKMEYRRRHSRNFNRDFYAYHLPSNLGLRTHKEVINYILYEVISKNQDEGQSKTSKKRKLALVAIDNNQEDEMVKEDEKEEDIHLEEDTIFASILEEIERENSKAETGQMVGSCGSIRQLCWGVQGSAESSTKLANCKVIEDNASSSQLSIFDESVNLLVPSPTSRIR